jgi:hypothetical protein
MARRRFAVNTEKDPKKLSAEELEKRVAPMALTYSDPTTVDPTVDPVGTSPKAGEIQGHHQGTTGGGGGGKLNQ